jgi:hypothetical protein
MNTDGGSDANALPGLQGWYVRAQTNSPHPAPTMAAPGIANQGVGAATNHPKYTAAPTDTAMDASNKPRRAGRPWPGAKPICIPVKKTKVAATTTKRMNSNSTTSLLGRHDHGGASQPIGKCSYGVRKPRFKSPRTSAKQATDCLVSIAIKWRQF